MSREGCQDEFCDLVLDSDEGIICSRGPLERLAIGCSPRELLELRENVHQEVRNAVAGFSVECNDTVGLLKRYSDTFGRVKQLVTE